MEQKKVGTARNSESIQESPNEEEFANSRLLEETLHKFGHGNSETEKFKRKCIISELDSLVKGLYVSAIPRESALVIKIRKINNFIYPTGSYTLGTVEKDSNLDLICLGPNTVNRAIFFPSLFNKLENSPKLNGFISFRKSKISSLHFTYMNVQVNVYYATMDMDYITGSKSIKSTTIYNFLDPESSLSLNGYHISKTILECIPRPESFNLALMALKLWAKRRGIYNDKFGFLGGTSLAILLARISQGYPNATAGVLISKLFKEYTEWRWPLPVILQKVDVGYSMLKSKLTEWKPISKYSVDYMPIITPTFPQRNSASNVTKSNRAIIVGEMTRGLNITNNILNGEKEWDSLFEPYDIFKKYKTFVVVKASVIDEEDESNWVNILESGVTQLATTLDRRYEIQQTHVWSTSYESSIEYEKYWFIGFIPEKVIWDTEEVEEEFEIISEQIEQKAAKAKLSEKVDFSVKIQDVKDLKANLPKDIISLTFKS